MSNVVDLAANAVRSYGKNSYIPKPFEHIWTCDTGELVPGFMTIKVNPGSTWKLTTSIMARLNTSRFPTIARGWIEYAWFYVPHMQIWDHWDQLMGENKESAWVSQTTYSVPKVEIPAGTVIQNGTFLDHIGWPTEVGDFQASALKLRAYLWVCDQFYRDQNIEEPIVLDGWTNDSNITYVTNGNYKTGGTLYHINRKADYFSTALPEPLKGPDVLIPLGATAPVTNTIEYSNPDNILQRVVSTTNNNVSPATGQLTYIVRDPNNAEVSGFKMQQDGPFINVDTSHTLKSTGIADLSQSGTNIYAIREGARTIQIFERDARSGTRAPEMLWARWGVEVDPLEMGRPRLLNMGRFPIVFEQVEQTSATDTDSPQGTLTAFGYTNNREENGTFSFKYAGTLMCLVAIRFEHKYQYGIPNEDLKFDRFDFWHPEFAGLGDQPIYDAEIYATGGANGTITTKSIFGYTTRGAEYKNFPSIISGQIRSNYAQSLDYVHMADKYNSLPTLSPAWMKENADNVDRTIFVTSNITKQWLVDMVIEMEITDTIPLYDIPGIDRI